MRGEGTFSALSRIIAEVRVCFSCTRPCHHRGALRRCSGLPLPFVIEIDHLANVVLNVSAANHHYVEASFGIGAGAGVFCRPIFSRLPADSFENHIHGVVKPLESLVFRRRIRIVEFARAIADVAGPRDLCADVVVQIARQMQNQVAEAVAKRKRLLSELGVGKRPSKLTDSGGVGRVALCESRRNGLVKFRHSPFFAGKSPIRTALKPRWRLPALASRPGSAW